MTSECSLESWQPVYVTGVEHSDETNQLCPSSPPHFVGLQAMQPLLAALVLYYNEWTPELVKGERWLLTS